MSKKSCGERKAMRSNFLALVLIGLGALFLMSNFGMLPHIGPIFRQWWPVVLIIAGIYLLVNRRGK
jgi:hypothetical protein